MLNKKNENEPRAFILIPYQIVLRKGFYATVLPFHANDQVLELYKKTLWHNFV